MFETQGDSGGDSSSRSGGSGGGYSSGSSGRGEVNRSEPNTSTEPKPGQSEKPKDAGPNKSEVDKSTEPKPGQSEKPKPEQNKTETGKTVVMGPAINDGKNHPGRGATGKDGHGLDRNPDAKDWYNKAARDFKASEGTKVQAPMSGKVTVDRDPNAKHDGHKFGDTVTITNGDFKVVLMHVDAKPGLEKQGEVKLGEDVAKVTHWDSNPNETHLHMATGVKGSDGAYHGVDPAPIVDGTQGGSGRDVTNLGNGSIVVGDQKYSMPAPPPERPSYSGRAQDESCTRR